jgi:hypothetical protein
MVETPAYLRLQESLSPHAASTFTDTHDGPLKEFPEAVAGSALPLFPRTHPGALYSQIGMRMVHNESRWATAREGTRSVSGRRGTQQAA